MEKTYDIKLDLYGSGTVKNSIQFVTGDENVYSITLRLVSTGPDKKETNYAIEGGTTVTVNIKPVNAVSSTDLTATVIDAQTGLLKVNFAGGFDVLGDYNAIVYLKKDSNTLTWGQRFAFNVAAGAATVE